MINTLLTCPELLGHRLSSVTPRGHSSVRRSLGPVADTPAHYGDAACCTDGANVRRGLGLRAAYRRVPRSTIHPAILFRIPSLRQASTTPSPLPNSISIVRNCAMISSAVYRLRAMLPPFAGQNLNSRSDLAYRRQVSRRPFAERLSETSPRVSWPLATPFEFKCANSLCLNLGWQSNYEKGSPRPRITGHIPSVGSRRLRRLSRSRRAEC